MVSLVLSLPNLYQATATVLIQRQEISESFVRPSVTGELDTRLQTISQEIMSRARLQDLITRFNLYPDLRQRLPPEALVERMRRDIRLKLKEVEGTGGRNVTIAFTLSYRGREPQTVARVTNALASSYVEENLKVRERQAGSTTAFLKGQLLEAQQKLDEQERRINDFKLRHSDELPQQVGTNLAL
ncbi:MAG TPA: hypothetical protein VLM91_18905, partial [Candidatus Methylomirabilis sp.]|nr:hypothetical protein [Candidatus Methylomirabilis sp.]